MKRILFICVHNSARSQMAEAFLRRLGGNEYVVESAGFDPTEINPLVIEVMREEGVDLSTKQTQSVFQLFKQGCMFHYVITVCDESEEGNCPIFPGMTHRLHLPFSDPAKLTGTHAEKLAKVREIRDSIKRRIGEFVAWERSGAEKPWGTPGSASPCRRHRPTNPKELP